MILLYCLDHILINILFFFFFFLCFSAMSFPASGIHSFSVFVYASLIFSFFSSFFYISLFSSGFEAAWVCTTVRRED